ncbi:IclR family transcriptional regulator, partial [Caballeronia sp.]|uniref:IclR family transcriptional regulator n=1 Tax=Caballeronia sp. TaxID=1931223 RepID=UPI003C369E8F
MSKTPKAAPVADIDRLAQAGTLLDSMDATSTVPRGARRGIQSIEIGFGIIDVLCKATGPLPLRTIAARCDLPVANVHNYLVSFQRVGLVVQESDSAFYGLGSYAMKLGIAALQQFDVHKVARPIMAEIGAETGFTVFLGVWGNKGPTIVY